MSYPRSSVAVSPDPDTGLLVFRTWTVLATPSRSCSAASFAAPSLNSASAIDPGLPG